MSRSSIMMRSRAGDEPVAARLCRGRYSRQHPQQRWHRTGQDMPATSVVVVPAQLEDPKETARQLAAILQADEEVLYEKLTNRVSTQKLQPEGRQIDDEQAAAIEALEMEGVYLVTDAGRYYPKGKLSGTGAGLYRHRQSGAGRSGTAVR